MFNPITAARQIIADTALTDPEQIADAVLDRTPKGSLRAAYRQLLRTAAREAIRMANIDASTPPSATPAPNRSSRVAAIRDMHIGYFDQRVYASGAWKMLGDCTVEDVLDLAAQRQAIADKNAAKAAEFTALAERMKTSGVATARQLEAVAA